MFYTESITSPKSNSFISNLFSRIMKAFEKYGYLRAEAELKRLGYYKEAMRIREHIKTL